ncbi:MAG: 50S ribosomal protein L32 [Candidatus Kerfeldbacteria bacterium]|nr:50S ribosomal protein L32 [Candidatus Kerfeldbacteria bacterium]
MTIPGKRLSSRHRKTRAAHHALAKITTVTCQQCHKQIVPHAACPFCGYYKGRKLGAGAQA